MRVSTYQSFRTSLSSMLEQQVKLQRTEQQIGTGLRLLRPSDDPGAAVRVINLEDNLATITQYRDNGTLAESQLSFEEGVLTNVGNALQRVRELTIQAANGTNSDASRAAIATEIEARLGQLMSLANSKDANGEYIFAGFSSSSIPFTVDGSGQTQYHGDQGQRQMQVGEGVLIAVRDSGAEVFLSIPGGNGKLDVQPGSSNTGTLIVRQYGLSAGSNVASYQVSFSQATPTDPISYSVEDNAVPPNVVDSGTYIEGQALSFAGVQLELQGLPADGDTITVDPPGKIDLFSSISRLLGQLGQSAANNSQQATIQNGYNLALNELDQAITHISTRRTAIGARLNIIDNQQEVNEDLEIQLQSALSDTRDLDYTEAISRFNTQLTALQAAQQSYVRLQSLSLLNYL